MNWLAVKFNNFLLKKLLNFTCDFSKIEDPEKRKVLAYLEAWISIIGNIILAVLKFGFGLLLNSIALLADAVHTASDVLTSLVVLLGFKLSSLPADEKHPHGHGRIEFIATLIISLMLIGVGIKFGIESFGRFKAGTVVEGSYTIALFMLIAGLLKELMSSISIDLGKRINSSALIADAWHHRTDAVASVLVAVAILASKYGYYKVDAILGLAVSVLIIWTGIEIFMDSSSKIIGESNADDLLKVSDLACSVKGVVAAHDIDVHNYGATKAISLHIEVENNLSMEMAHDVAHKVEDLINKNMYAKTTVHVDKFSENRD
ncbi:cation diffusion facilitator family transporter [Thermosyntropha sp.]|uniref:cation diffusion facilitator family transporter n=1 Tax=Thermosyntropha sp. TaxID=2740820 RepID=UPI0025F43DF1|nr:cation diffusion facilitator family transporter [Thermosyntropha sp.]MBO8158412.1 cation transporter [Thermosyntropha sp.]